jgi:hypothetical protein
VDTGFSIRSCPIKEIAFNPDSRQKRRKQERCAAKALCFADSVTGASHEIIAARRRNDRRDRNLGFCARGLLGGRRPRDRQCEIVTSNPVINNEVGGAIWFGSGPYQSLDDAKLARSTIRGCPVVEEPSAEAPDQKDKSD